MDWQERFSGGRPAAWWDKIFAQPPRPAGRKVVGACFCCTEGWRPDSAVGEATVYEILAPMAGALNMPRQVIVHNLCAFGFETDLLRRIKRREPFSAAHLAAHRAAESRAQRDVPGRVSVRLA